jgi:acetyl esterase/lipase
MDGRSEPAPVDVDSPYEAQLAFCDEAEPGFQALFAALYADLPPIDGVERSTATTTGVDGNEITLHVHRPAGTTGPLPAVLHLHGGGMTILSAADPSYARWRDELAAAGCVAVGVEFRNAAGALGPHPFPAGLHDCGSALQWLHDHRAELGVSAIVVSGESGGGNLTLATTLAAKRDGRLDQIDGVYAQCPYISGLYATQPPELPSMTENDDYFLACRMMGAMAAVYTAGQPSTDPLAWPYHATVDDVSGLPPHVISVNELDPLRDEGLAYHRKLVAAGVSSVGRVVAGTCHAGDVIFAGALPDVYAASRRDLVGFARSLG